MRVCGNCQSDIPDGSSTCTRCGAEAPRGFFSFLSGLFQKRPPEPAPARAPGGSSLGARATAGSSPGSFRFEVEDVFTITGRGMVATGRVLSGRIAKGDEICFRSPKGEVVRRTIVGIETVGRLVDAASEGEAVGLLFTKPVPFDVLVRGVVFERA